MTIEGLTEPSTLRRAAIRSLALMAISAVLLLSPAPAHGEQTGVTGLTLTSETPGVIVVTWDVPEQTPTDYRVNWAKSSEDFPSYTAGVGNGNEYPATNEETIEDLDEGVEYKVRVRARYRDDQLIEGQDKPWSTPWSDEKTVTVAKGKPPTKPRDLTGTVTHDSVTLSWTEPKWGGEATGYRIGRWQRGVHDPGRLPGPGGRHGQHRDDIRRHRGGGREALCLPGLGPERLRGERPEQLSSPPTCPRRRQCCGRCPARPRTWWQWAAPPT